VTRAGEYQGKGNLTKYTVEANNEDEVDVEYSFKGLITSRESPRHLRYGCIGQGRNRSSAVIQQKD